MFYSLILVIFFFQIHKMHAQWSLVMINFVCIFIIVVVGSVMGSENEIPQRTDKELLNEKMRIHAKAVEKQIKALDTFIDTYYKDYNFTEEDAHEYVSNPINTYMLIKRTSLEWPRLKHILFNDSLDKQYEEIIKLSDALSPK